MNFFNEQNPYSFFLNEVEKPARYVGGEKFSIKKDWEKTPAKIALCFPDVYEIGMSHLGYKILYDNLNKVPQILAERVYTPWIDMEKKLREEDLPLVTLESFKSLSEFDVLGFSLQYEMTYTNILTMLDLGEVPLWQKEREESDPFVIAGGPCATHPEPLVPFFDFFVIGDGEEIFANIALYIAKARKEKISRSEILKTLAKWRGIYVPSLYETIIDENTEFEVISKSKHEGIPERVERFFLDDLHDHPFPIKTPIPHLTAIFDNYSVELARGCTEGCRFCQAGMIYRPVRERKPKEVMDTILEGLKVTGHNQASLTCLSTADYSAITPLILNLLDEMYKDKSTLGIASLRAYGLDTRVLDKMAEVKNSALTFAPEAGTERMRKVINKNISEEDMMNTAKEVFSRGWSKMKLYFMIGLPTEEDEDVFGIIETASNARKVAREQGVRNPTITVSVSSFVPKPHTPFQWSPMITLSEIERKQSIILEQSRKNKLNFRKHYSKTSILEGLIARGDRKVAQVIYDAWKDGARFDSWTEGFDFDLWMKAVTKNDIDLQRYLGTIRLDGKLPWSHIDVGLEDNFLEREYKKALKNRFSPPCGKPAKAIVHPSTLEEMDDLFVEKKKKLVCYHCGLACDLTGMLDERKDFLTSLDSKNNQSLEKFVTIKKIENLEVSVGDSLEEAAKKDTETISFNRERRGQNIGYSYRLKFAKFGPMTFTSHLDLQKVISRIFKRADIDVLYSEGFHPRPLLSFGPALPLGMSSYCEYFEVRTGEKWVGHGEILKKLNEASENGVKFYEILSKAVKTKSLQSSLTQFSYFVPRKLDDKDSDFEKRSDDCFDLSKLEAFSVERQLAKGKKTKNVFPAEYIKKIMLCDLLKIDKTNSSFLEYAKDENLHGDGVLIDVKVKEGKTLRPREIMATLKELDENQSWENPIKIEAAFS